ncbi:MAG: sodium/solute symporter, partial [Phycisphaeraceae bacterium]|nr:sodium/solute symporter [Phycisphaeraceae bacterium]
LPPLPQPCANGAAAILGNVVYLAGGQSGAGLESAMDNFWSLDLSQMDKPGGELAWKPLPTWPGPTRAFNLTVMQHNGFDNCIYVISGRRQQAGVEGNAGMTPLTDMYEFDPTTYAGKLKRGATEQEAAEAAWIQRPDVPVCVMAGTGIGIGQSHVFVFSGADGSLFAKADELKDAHPGFPKRLWAYHAITNTWIDAGELPANQVTTPAVQWGKDIIIAAGEVRPRVRTAAVWRIEPLRYKGAFGAINSTVLVMYLLAMVGVGVYFANKNKDTNDYFRGGQRIPWWAVACSIYATMLSSITYMAIPAKAYAQDLVYMAGHLMIVAMAPVAIYVALPFFRQIDATSAYEYLSKRFNMPVRMVASGLFTLFHIGRMGIVLSLAALALTSVTPLTPVQSVLIMGVLCLIYCTLGGIEAVIWTDTIQTFVLLGGALLCLVLIILRIDGGVSSMFSTAYADGKLHTVNWDFSLNSYTSTALWVVLLGAFGQNFSSYVSDQAVVQRYMTTPSFKTAARSIWTNAWMAIPSALIFYGMGVALYTFYKQHPARLSPTMNTDQVFPLFLSNEVFVGVAGLVVAGIFAAAQSTVSTSMNSTATTIVTDFLRPMKAFKSERGYLHAARALTFTLGALGTLIGLLFIDPSIKSLFDSALAVIGIFMGVLGGLFALGLLTTRANGWGTLVGLICGALVMFCLPYYSQLNLLMYATTGIATCFVIGYLASIVLPCQSGDLTGLTVFTMSKAARVAAEAG